MSAKSAKKRTTSGKDYRKNITEPLPYCMALDICLGFHFRIYFIIPYGHMVTIRQIDIFHLHFFIENILGYGDTFVLVKKSFQLFKLRC